ncbi:hypothetical protein Cadr_000001069 [Camelus dromedarius]|uniref:Uncharacterized protein n=1 Tax=Camelus dromedarius TaxID=9838 RepID=A0A5N4EIE8_CAMDR|nr:hypothetical protein Cadr_000001069 [Camelus dromedarius]
MAVETAMAVDLALIMAVVMELDMAVDMAPAMAVDVELDMAVDMVPAVAVDMALALALATAATGQFAIGCVILLAARPSLSKPHLLLKQHIYR